jgi:hypothetical protein
VGDSVSIEAGSPSCLTAPRIPLARCGAVSVLSLIVFTCDAHDATFCRDVSTSTKQPCQCNASHALAELRIAIGRVIADYQSAALRALERDDPSAAWYLRVAEHLKSEIKRSNETELESHHEQHTE